MSPVASEPTVSDTLDQWRAAVRTSRHITGPPLIAGALAGLAWVAYEYTAAWWVFLALWLWVMWVGLCSVPGLPQRSSVPQAKDDDPEWRQWYLWGQRNVERLYALGAWIGGGLWSLTASVLGPSLSIAAAGAVVLAPLWAAWFHHRRIRLSVAVELDVSAWGDGSEVGLMGTAARGVAAGVGWFRVRVTPAKGTGRRLYDHAAYRNASSKVAALFGVRARDVTMVESSAEAEVEYVVRTKEREIVAAPMDLTMDRIVGRKRLGTTGDGEVVETALVLDGRDGIGAGGQHGVTVGVTGSGKSSEANVNAAHGARALDAGLIVWDFSFGAAELRAWADCCWMFCHTVEQATASLRWLMALCEHRGRTMKGRFQRITRKVPGVVLVGDEVASLFAPHLLPEDRRTGDPLIDMALSKAQVEELVQLWTKFLRLCRKYGVAVRVATQYGVDEALGGETAKQQLGIFRSVFRCNRDQDAAVIMPLSLARTSEFPMNKPGTCHHVGPTTPQGGSRLRADYLDDDTIASMVEAWKDHQPLPEPALRSHPDWVNRNTTPPALEEDAGWDEGDDDEPDDDEDGELRLPPEVRARVRELEEEDPEYAAAVDEALANRDAEAVPDEPQDAPAGEAKPSPRRRVTSTQATQDQAYGVLAGQDEVSTLQLATILGYSRRYAGQLLAALVDAGRATKVGSGPRTRYRAVPRDDWPVIPVNAGSTSGSG